MSAPDFMATVYACVSAVEEGKVGEVQVEHRYLLADGSEEIVTVSAYREVRHFQPHPED
jgi:hypothetical protein